MQKITILLLWALFACSASAAHAGYSADESGREIRTFILYNYRNLALDILASHGRYLDALSQIIAPECRPASKSKLLLNQLVATPDQVQFAVTISHRCARSPIPEQT